MNDLDELRAWMAERAEKPALPADDDSESTDPYHPWRNGIDWALEDE